MMGKRTSWQGRARLGVLLALSLGIDPAVRAQPSTVDVQPSGEVEVFAERGTQISVDGEPAQQLPLSAPLLLRAGQHVITATQGRSTLSTQVDVRAGRAQEVRFSFSVQAVSITVPPHALLLEQYEGIPKAAEEDLAITTVRALSKQRLTLIQLPRDAVLPSSCLEQTACLTEQAAKQQVDYTVVLSVTASAGPSDPADKRSYRVRAQIVDRSVGQSASTISDLCPGCSVEMLKDKLSQVLSPLASAALTRKKGFLRIQTEPSQAEIFINGERVGMAPLQRRAWAGTVELRASLPGYRVLEQRVDVAESAESSVTLKLEPAEQEWSEQDSQARKRRVIVIDGSRSSVERAPRPRWRLIAGAAGIGAGGVLLGIGAGALSVDGQCITTPEGTARHCDALYATRPLGLGLVATGSALLLGGVLTMAWPGKVIPPKTQRTQGVGK
jgi:hypothetical protein